MSTHRRVRRGGVRIEFNASFGWLGITVRCLSVFPHSAPGEWTDELVLEFIFETPSQLR
jgi:hypothetical protein